MDEQTRNRSGRSFQAQVKGDSITDLENEALLKAQEFFGPGVPLQVDEDYRTDDRDTFALDGRGRYRAFITVRPAI